MLLPHPGRIVGNPYLTGLWKVCPSSGKIAKTRLSPTLVFRAVALPPRDGGVFHPPHQGSQAVSQKGYDTANESNIRRHSHLC